MQFIRPRRRFDTAALALDAPLPIVVTCAGRDLSWPTGKPHSQPPPLIVASPICEECGKPTNGHARWCGFCDPLAD